MPKAASLRNLRPWKPGQSGNPNGRPRAPRFTERDQHAILTALAGAFGEGTQGAAINAMQAVLTNPRTVLKALELLARLNGELDSPHRVTTPLKLYTIYSPPNHPDGTVHKTKSEAEAAEGAEHHR